MTPSSTRYLCCIACVFLSSQHHFDLDLNAKLFQYFLEMALGHQVKKIPETLDFAILWIISCLYIIISVYICISNVIYVSICWKRLRKEGRRGPLLMHICLIVAPLCFTVEYLWNQMKVAGCSQGQWTKDDCLAWKRVRNTLSALSESLVILFFWLRSQTFYLSPLLSALFLTRASEKATSVLNYILLILIAMYPIGYMAYSTSSFWLEHHEFNYSNSSFSPIGGSSHILVAVGDLEGGPVPHPDNIPMILSSSLQFYQLLLHFLVIVPLLLPFIQIGRQREMPEVESLLKRNVVLTSIILLLNLATWVLSALLAPFMPVSKFLLDTIADMRISAGVIMACLALKNGKQVLKPWKDIMQRSAYSIGYTATSRIIGNNSFGSQ